MVPIAPKTGHNQQYASLQVTTKSHSSHLPKSSVTKRAGSGHDKVENPTTTNRMLSTFARIGMPNFYKLDKQTYLRGDIVDIGQKVGKKLEECDALIDYERRKNQAIAREKVEMQQQINGLIQQAKQDEEDKTKVRE